ncbi:MAG: recombinase family protein [Actinomycetota bacterium]|nr:recombinase family protein [Actinomycetota bacterium]
MPSANGHSPKTAVLYARVSTEEQARSGYSLAQQIEALRDHAEREGYEVLEEVVDRGQSGASLARPGMDRVRDLVAIGSISVVLAQDRDRFAREPAYHYLLRREFEEHGTRLRALNDRGDESPEGELTDGILDQLAKYERAKIAERSRRGKLRKAREGKTMRTAQPPFGFRYNTAGDALIPHEPEMAVVEKVFRLAAEGMGIWSIQARLHAAGIQAPKGGKVWDIMVIKRLVLNELYKPHSYDEMSALLGPEALARLTPGNEYGVRWHNRHKITRRVVSEPDGNGGRRYKKRSTTTLRAREEWVAVPVPARIPRAVVNAARERIETGGPAERKYLTREWELRGLMRCSCGATMRTQTTRPKDKYYHYYACSRRRKLRKMCNCRQPNVQASAVEPIVWEFVRGLLQDPERIRRGMDKMIALERETANGSPDREAVMWSEKLAEAERKRARYQEMAAESLITFDELRAKLADLQETSEMARRELEGIETRKERAEQLERDRDALLTFSASFVPEALESLSGEERNRIYRLLRLEITPQGDKYLVQGVFCTERLSPTGRLWA